MKRENYHGRQHAKEEFCNPYRFQHVLGRAVWNADEVRDFHQSWVGESLVFAPETATRMGKQVKRLKNYLGRVVRDIERKLTGVPLIHLVFDEALEKSRRLLRQTKDFEDKLYSLHAPEVECIGKGKAHKRYEFGGKVSLAVTHKQGLVLSSQALHGNSYDGYTLAGTLDHAAEITGRSIQRAFVDKGYKKHGVEAVKVIISGQGKLSRSLKEALRRRNAVEPHIGHMKTEGKLGRNYLKGTFGDKSMLTLTLSRNERSL